MFFFFPIRNLRAGLVVCACFLAACGNATGPTPTVFQPKVTIYPIGEPTATLLPPTRPPATTAPATVAAATLTPTLAIADPSLNPFTGIKAKDAASLARKPMLVKVANGAEPGVRPQSGLAEADVVVEHYVEGGITRLTALFQTNEPPRVGSVRSCRLLDIELAPMFGGAVACSGMSGGVKQEMRASTYLFDKGSTDLSKSTLISPDFGMPECEDCMFYRVTTNFAPHNLFANVTRLREELARRGKNEKSPFASWTFSPAPAGVSAMADAGTVSIPYSSGMVTWRFDSASGLWQRAVGGVPHMDQATGKPLAFANVMIVYANHLNTLIVEDASGAKSIQIQLWNSGQVKLLRDAKLQNGAWERKTTIGAFDLVSDSKPLPLKPGNTWIEVVPLDMQIDARP